jgi:hypothetical protein
LLGTSWNNKIGLLHWKEGYKKTKVYNNRLDLGFWSQKEYQNHVAPLIAFTEFANAVEFRKKIINDLS